MAQSTRTFRIFVSSTFSDLKAERNALQEKVFPRLRDFTSARGCRFQAIDLRWGVSDEASLDQQAMNICLGEIARCQQTSPRPNFIVLLGDRYGWCPPPAQIPKEVFDQILGVVKNSEDRKFLEKWYFLDNNAVPAEWRLKPRSRGSDYESYDGWQPVEEGLHTILVEAVGKLNFSLEQRLPFIASATEQEINAGALRVKEAPEHVFCFFRRVDGLPQQFKAAEFLSAVKARLKQEYPGGLSQSSQIHVRTIEAMPPNSSAKDFANQLKQDLKRTPKATPEEEVLNVIWQVLVDITAKDFLNLDEKEWTVDKNAYEKQQDLKNRLQAYVPGNIFPYQARWTGEGITTDKIGTIPDKLEQCLPMLEDDFSATNLCEAVWHSLGCIIKKEIEEPHKNIPTEEIKLHIKPDEALDAEGLAHHRFAEERLRFFVGRTEMLKKINGYLTDSGHRSLAIVGAGGTGKSALIARAIQQTQEMHPKAEIVYRFIGATPGSSDGRGLLDSLCHEISRRFGADASDIPTDYRDLVPELGKRMQLASLNRPLILFLDSLDQISASQDARSLIWLPNELPEHVSMVVSTREEDTLKALQAKQARQEVLGGLSRKEGDDLLSQWLASVRRSLQEIQRKEVLDKFETSKGNPLYLKLAFEEARLWTSDEPLEQLEPGVSGIIKMNMIKRLEKEGSHGKALVEHALGYLAASRHGLAEDELVDLLSRDFEVYRWFMEGSHHLPSDLIRSAIRFRTSHGMKNLIGDGKPSNDEERAALAWLKEIRNPPEQVADFLIEVLPKIDGPQLPVVLWSRLSFDLAPYLTERMVDSSPLLNFYHRELGDVSTEVFLSQGKDQSYHTRLADYFRFKADPDANNTWNGKYLHGLSELPYHLTRAARYEEVFKTLTDFKFLEHKAAEVGVRERKDEKGEPVRTYTGVLQLQEDFEEAMASMPGGEGGMFDRAPLILTALETSKGLMVYCPVCNKYSPIRKKMLDTVIACPQENCKMPIKLNPFTVKREM